ncbi:MAG TPA: hypothetical protein VNO33_24030 [Kofleriaceae bacterium]|nr:hypothetical protein [Kofleriaceae bacterium]
MRIALSLLATWLFAAGCRAPLSGAPCPCLSGYTCDLSLDVCVEGSGTPSDGSTGDGGALPDGSGGFPSDSGPPDADFGVPDASGGFPDGDLPDASGLADFTTTPQ